MYRSILCLPAIYAGSSYTSTHSELSSMTIQNLSLRYGRRSLVIRVVLYKDMKVPRQVVFQKNRCEPRRIVVPN